MSQTPNILQVIAYHPKDYDNSVLRIHNKRNWTTHGVHYPILSASGALDLLPIEMLSAVLQFSDLHTISTLRLVNRRTKGVVDGFIPYNLIVTHAPHVLDVLTLTGVASHFTAVQVFDVLCSDSCAICGGFGGFLWIPDCIRCCIPCMRESHKLMPMTERDAKAAFGLSQKALSKVPIVHTLPGIYTLAQVAYDRRVARRNATRSCFDSNREINNTIDDVSRFLVTTRLPYFNSESRSTETGLSCKGCQVALERGFEQLLLSVQVITLLKERDRTFTEDMFLDHFATCTDAQRIWASYRADSKA
ncbi:hypothetical protein BYT27DRAFT_7119324 [Phlegmacium glaucopus]|nr:hypothetical protein BYT27DRAFT_7119324 [Phlegmacium glaucopus]